MPEKFREKVFRNSTIQNADSLGNSLNLLKPVNQHLSLKARRSNDSGNFHWPYHGNRITSICRENELASGLSGQAVQVRRTQIPANYYLSNFSIS